MDVEVIIPWRESRDGTRTIVKDWVVERYRRLHPDWEVRISEPDTEQWNKARAVNLAIRDSESEILVVADADVALDPDLLQAAAALVASKRAPWVMPFTAVRRLTQKATAKTLAVEPDTLPDYRSGDWDAHQRYCVGGGVFVVRRSSLLQVGGMDDRFQGWGGEDRAIGFALDTLVGTHVAFDAIGWHLWHQPQSKHTYNNPRRPNSILIKRYQIAARESSGQAMWNLVHERLTDGS